MQNVLDVLLDFIPLLPGHRVLPHVEDAPKARTTAPLAGLSALSAFLDRTTMQMELSRLQHVLFVVMGHIPQPAAPSTMKARV